MTLTSPVFDATSAGRDGFGNAIATTAKPVVLHVTSVFDGGVSRAIEKVVKLLPEYEHHLLAAGNEVDDGAQLFSSTITLPASGAAALLAVRRRIHDLRPAIVHAHSSWAGFFARAAAQPDTHLVYQPHCFVMQDPARAAWKKAIFQIAEHVLSLRAQTVIALTGQEEALGRRLLGARWGKVRLRRVPNAAHRTPDDATTDHPWRTRRPRVAMIGRICAQKDPRFFAQVARACFRRGDDVDFIWIGDGDDEAKHILLQCGVNVTGWVGGDRLDELLRDVDIYVHSARYEGFPLSVLDAASYHIPIVVRDIPCFTETPLLCAHGVLDAADQVHEIVEDDRFEAEVADRSVAILRIMNDDQQRSALRSCYLATMQGR